MTVGCFGLNFNSGKRLSRTSVKSNFAEIQRLRAIVAVLDLYVDDISEEFGSSDSTKNLFKVPEDAKSEGQIDKFWLMLDETFNKEEAEEILNEKYQKCKKLEQKVALGNILSSLLLQRLEANPRRLFSISLAFSVNDGKQDLVAELRKNLEAAGGLKSEVDDEILFLVEYFSLLQSVSETDAFFLDLNQVSKMVFKSLCLEKKDSNLEFSYICKINDDINSNYQCNLKYAIYNGQMLHKELVSKSKSKITTAAGKISGSSVCDKTLGSFDMENLEKSCQFSEASYVTEDGDTVFSQSVHGDTTEEVKEKKSPRMLRKWFTSVSFPTSSFEPASAEVTL